MSKIGIIGHGYVGKAVEYGFKGKNEILIYDKFKETASLDKVVSESEFVFVCVPTPMTHHFGEIDLSIVEEVVGEIVDRARRFKVRPVIVIKSTVIPGTTKRLARENKWEGMLFNPEFLTEANYLEDFVNADRIVVGGDETEIRQSLVKLYEVNLPGIPIFQTDPTAAEMVKYMANTYLATKVAFANEIFDLCQKLGVKYEEVKEMVVADKRIYDSHLDVTSQRGFGGKCFPKDTVALLGLGREVGVKMEVLEAAWKKNLRIRKMRDWEEIEGAVSKKK